MSYIPPVIDHEAPRELMSSMALPPRQAKSFGLYRPCDNTLHFLGSPDLYFVPVAASVLCPLQASFDTYFDLPTHLYMFSPMQERPTAGFHPWFAALLEAGLAVAEAAEGWLEYWLEYCPQLELTYLLIERS